MHHFLCKKDINGLNFWQKPKNGRVSGPSPKLRIFLKTLSPSVLDLYDPLTCEISAKF